MFIHGLTGDWRETWTYRQPYQDVCWPQDLLPSDIQNARIIAFGYDAEVAHMWAPAGQNNLCQHADALVTHLSLLRQKTKTVGAAYYFQLAFEPPSS